MCEFCNKFDFSTAKVEIDKYGARLLTGISNTKLPEVDQFNFCPVCGMILPKKSRLEEKAKFEIWNTACHVSTVLEEIAHEYGCDSYWIVDVFKDHFNMVLEERGYEVD